MNSIGFSNLLVYFINSCYKLIKANKFNKVAAFASNIDMSLHQLKSAMASQPSQPSFHKSKHVQLQNREGHNNTVHLEQRTHAIKYL